MPAFVKFQQFVVDLGKKVHDLNADTLKIYLTNTTPDVAADAVKGDLAEITNEHGYTAPIDIENAFSGSGGTGTVTGVDKTITASGGTIGPFRYVVLYNDTPSSPTDPLIGYWDYASAITLNDGEQFVWDVGASVFTIA